MKPGLKYYGFKKGNETGVKIFREKKPENLGMKTWIHLEPPSESFQMVTLHSTPRIFEVGHINETDTGILQLPCQFSRLRLKSISQIFYFSFNKDVFLC